MKNPGFGIFNPLVRFFFKLLVKPLRKADYRAAGRPDYFVTISEYAKEQIAKYYDREAVVIHPPVEINDFKIKSTKSQEKQGNNNSEKSQICGDEVVENYFVVTSRQVNWKRLDLAIKACEMTKNRLLVIGEGPEHDNLVRLASGSELVKFLPLMKKAELCSYLAKAKGYLFPSLEPFGIAPVEALAAGCPVIAYGKGGALDYVIDGKNGVLFDKQTVGSLVDAILRFEKMKFKRDEVTKSAAKFDLERFDEEIREFVDEKTK